MRCVVIIVVIIVINLCLSLFLLPFDCELTFLSVFLFGQHTLINEYLAQIVSWIESDQLRVAEVTVFDMDQLPEAHRLIQSGMSVGKIVVRCGADDDDSETDEKGQRKGRGGLESEERRGQPIDEARGDTRGGKGEEEEGEGLTATATAVPVRSESNAKKKQKTKKAKKN